jgi:hypothetical protein
VLTDKNNPHNTAQARTQDTKEISESHNLQEVIRSIMTPPPPTMKQHPASPLSPKPTTMDGEGLALLPGVPTIASASTVSSSRDRLQQLMSVGGASNSDFDKIVKERIKVMLC